MGYYHESPKDRVSSVTLWRLLRALGRLGVAVVASAGNDATIRPAFPAAFSLHSEGDDTRVPLTSVGALNPDGTRAAFSNAGTWVRTWAPGANVVSTVPVTFDGAENPTVTSTDPDGSVRRTIDPDGYGGGFGIWSGTSFAGPLVAGRIAGALDTLWRGCEGGPDDRSVETAVATGRTARDQALEGP